MSSNLSIKLEDSPSTTLLDAIEAGLDDFNETKGILWDEVPLVVSLQNEQGKILAGLRGRTVLSWLHIKHLWVDESLRGQGWGDKLVREAEKEAKSRDCIGSFLDTFSFQAEGFYKKLGYEVFGELKDFPPGESKIFLKKLL